MGATETLLRERAALCDTLGKVGGDAPTLCDGWTTLDLAAHLVAREARSDAALGLVLPGPFARHMQSVMDTHKTRGYDALVAMLRTGPPVMHRKGPLASANCNENFVHHEDVRRAAGEGPRDLDPELDAVLWRMMGLGARLTKRRVKGAALVLRTPDARERTVSTSGKAVMLTGTPGELALYLGGRKGAAQVTFEGDPDGIAIVQQASLGV
jgi:uncharacterized protein (TIGR03085 family)